MPDQPNNEPQPEVTPPVVDAPEPTPTAGGNEPEPGKTFTQEEVNRIAAQRAERERQKYADYDETKAELEKLRNAENERKQAEMTELEKLQAKYDAEAKARADAEAERTRIEAEAASERLKYAVLAKAAELEFEHPEDVYELVKPKLSGVKLGDDGEYAGLEDAVKALDGRLPKKKSKLPGPRIEPTNPGGSGQPGETDAQKKARIFGTSPDVFNPDALRQKGGGAFITSEQVKE